MYGIFTHIWLIFIVNVGQYTIDTWIVWEIFGYIPYMDPMGWSKF